MEIDTDALAESHYQDRDPAFVDDENEPHDTKTKDFLYELASKMYDLVACTFENMTCHGIEITDSIKQSVMDDIEDIVNEATA